MSADGWQEDTVIPMTSVSQSFSFGPDLTIPMFKSMAAQIVASVPVEYVDSARVDLERDYDTGLERSFEVTYYRPKTTEELAEEERRRQVAEQGKIDQRYRQFQRLKQEFGE